MKLKTSDTSMVTSWNLFYSKCDSDNDVHNVQCWICVIYVGILASVQLYVYLPLTVISYV